MESFSLKNRKLIEQAVGVAFKIHQLAVEHGGDLVDRVGEQERPVEDRDLGGKGPGHGVAHDQVASGGKGHAGRLYAGPVLCRSASILEHDRLRQNRYAVLAKA